MMTPQKLTHTPSESYDRPMRFSLAGTEFLLCFVMFGCCLIFSLGARDCAYHLIPAPADNLCGLALGLTLIGYPAALLIGGIPKGYYATRVLFPALAVLDWACLIVLACALKRIPALIPPFLIVFDCTLRSFCAFYCRRSYLFTSLLAIDAMITAKSPHAHAAYYTVLCGLILLTLSTIGWFAWGYFA